MGPDPSLRPCDGGEGCDQTAAGIKGLTVGPVEYATFVEGIVEVARDGLEAVGIAKQ